MGLAVERLLQLRAFEPLRELRRYLAKNPEISPDAACAALISVDESFSASDHEAALELHGLLDPSLIFVDFDVDLRGAIATVILLTRPQWAKRVFLGRKRLLSEMEDVDAEVQRCFNQAGLFAKDPPKDIVDWWYQLKHEMRGFLNFDNAMQGRAAEELSLELERAKVKELGLTVVPEWRSFDDDTAGFDVLSYRPSGGEYPTNLLIEVKSSSRNPPIAIITRNEWKKAQDAKEGYIFHVWQCKEGKPDKLFVWTYDMIAEHIPSDGGQGEWLDVAIPMKAVKATGGSNTPPPA